MYTRIQVSTTAMFISKLDVTLDSVSHANFQGQTLADFILDLASMQSRYLFSFLENLNAMNKL